MHSSPHHSASVYAFLGAKITVKLVLELAQTVINFEIS